MDRLAPETNRYAMEREQSGPWREPSGPWSEPSGPLVREQHLWPFYEFLSDADEGVDICIHIVVARAHPCTVKK